MGEIQRCTTEKCIPVAELRKDVEAGLDKAEMQRMNDIAIAEIERKHQLEHSKKLNEEMAKGLAKIRESVNAIQLIEIAYRATKEKLDNFEETLEHIKASVKRHEFGKDGAHSLQNKRMKYCALALGLTWLYIADTHSGVFKFVTGLIF